MKFFTDGDIDPIHRLDIARHRVRLWSIDVPRSITRRAGQANIVDFVCERSHVDQLVHELYPHSSWDFIPINTGQQPALWIDSQAVDKLKPSRGRMVEA